MILAATVSLGVLTQQVVQSHYGYKFSNKYAFPTEYWIGLSYNKYSNGTVIGNKHTFEYTAKIDGYENKKDRDTKLIKNEIKNLGVLGILRQYNNKVNVMFSDGTVGMVGRQNSLYPKFSKFTKLIDGENDVIVGMVSQSVYVVSLLSVIALSIKSIIKRKKIWLLDLFLIFFTGIFMFHVFLWEVETRYLFLTIPLLLSVGSSELVTTGTAKLNLNKVTSVRLKIVFVIFFLVFFEQTFFNNKGLMVTKIFNEPVQEQTFFRMSPQVIPAHHRLKQNFILNDEPNFADVDIGSLNSKIKVKIVDRATGKSVIKNRKSDGYALIRNSGNLSISVTNISSKPTTILINESNLPSKIDVYGTSGIKINKRKEVFLNETFYKRVTDQRLHDLYKIISAIVVILVIIIIFII